MTTTQQQSIKKSKFKLSSLFFEESPTATPPADSPPISVAVPREVVIPQAAVTSDPKIKESLMEALEENALGSYDYLKFKKTSDTLQGVVPDETSRYKAAFVAAQTLNISKDKLVETAHHYLAVMAEEHRKFNEAIEAANKDKVVAGENRLKEIDKIIAHKSEIVQKTTEEISVLQKEKFTVHAKLTEDKTKIESTKSGFQTAYNNLVQDIKLDVEKIQRYL